VSLALNLGMCSIPWSLTTVKHDKYIMNLNIDQAYREGPYAYSLRVKRILHLEIGEG